MIEHKPAGERLRQWLAAAASGCGRRQWPRFQPYDRPAGPDENNGLLLFRKLALLL